MGCPILPSRYRGHLAAVEGAFEGKAVKVGSWVKGSSLALRCQAGVGVGWGRPRENFLGPATGRGPRGTVQGDRQSDPREGVGQSPEPAPGGDLWGRWSSGHVSVLGGGGGPSPRSHPGPGPLARAQPRASQRSRPGGAGGQQGRAEAPRDWTGRDGTGRVKRAGERAPRSSRPSSARRAGWRAGRQEASQEGRRAGEGRACHAAAAAAAAAFVQSWAAAGGRRQRAAPRAPPGPELWLLERTPPGPVPACQPASRPAGPPSDRPPRTTERRPRLQGSRQPRLPRWPVPRPPSLRGSAVCGGDDRAPADKGK
ncbi:translation initiation factor IF-2-like [Trichosurus vulpecula]|uniref:translation initiation factor IF-2-like n=1 Tax=Trichosurus vulpecula TaxID=9337 RepID=UPI00186B4D72|nr:translation initiation factor IF-2-like [Trichosurus vulpecula]